MIDKLSSEGLTIAKLKQCSDTRLLELGLDQSSIDEFRAEKRPPIPEDIVIRLLHESKRTCCVCRNPGRPIIIHHIDEWSSSHSHSEDNLVVLCLEHHDAAHTKKALSLSLTAGQVKEHKAKWLSTVRTEDSKAVLGLARVEGARWDFFNHLRLFELATHMKIDLRALNCFPQLLANGMVSESGLIASLPLIDLSNLWSKTRIEALITSGTWIALQAAFHFRRMNEAGKGRNQTRRALRRRNGIEIVFEFDAWESTSGTSQNVHLSHYQTAVAILQVRTISRQGGRTQLSCSCLAIGTGFAEGRLMLNHRPPPSQRDRWLGAADEAEEGPEAGNAI
jgi:hypothetical protein